MGTIIGQTHWSIHITDDLTTPTYLWYFNGNPRMQFPLKAGTTLDGAHGKSVIKKIGTIDITWELNTVIQSGTDFQSMMKALLYWNAHSTLLYLSIQNEWNVEMAVFSEYTTPETLTQLKGQVQNFQIKKITSNDCEVSIQFKFADQTKPT